MDALLDAEVAEKDPKQFLNGTIATGDRFVTGDAMRTAAIEATHADCVEMEGAAIAHIAAKNGVDCLVLRAISDNCDDAYDAFASASSIWTSMPARRVTLRSISSAALPLRNRASIL